MIKFSPSGLTAALLKKVGVCPKKSRTLNHGKVGVIFTDHCDRAVADGLSQATLVVMHHVVVGLVSLAKINNYWNTRYKP
jgi:hypothetical protein